MNIRTKDITATTLKDIHLDASIEDPPDDLALVLIRGVPAEASLSQGEREKDGTWKITAAELEQISITLPQAPSGPLQLQFEARDRIGNRIGAAATMSITVCPTARSKPCPEWIKVVGAVVLVVFSVAVFWCWRILYQSAQGVLTHDWSVQWAKPQEILLRSGPVTFWY